MLRGATRRFSTAAVFALFATNSAQAVEISLISQFAGAENNSEIINFSADENTIVSTVSNDSLVGVQILEMDGSGNITERADVNLIDTFGTADDMGGASSTALDPLGRGFGVVSLIPDDNDGTQGKVAIFDYRAGVTDRVLTVLDVGFHPDSVTFSPDGSQIVVVNEGETTTGGLTDAPGSVSLIDLTGVGGVGDINMALPVTDIDFSAGNLATGVTLNELRNNQPTTTPIELNVEPEFVKVDGNLAYVSLQENNAVGVLDLTTQQWTAIYPLGTIDQIIDASDRDGDTPGSITIMDPVTGLPMPDAIDVFTVDGQTYFATANEGDLHPDDLDRSERIADIPRSEIDDAYEAELDALYAPDDFQDNEHLGRLRVSNVDGRDPVTGEYVNFVMPGTRSFSIWNADTGELVFDPGSLEPLLASLDPNFHNAEDGLPWVAPGDEGEFDGRSDAKGPEPEAISVVQLDNGVTLLALGMERQNGLLIWDISNPLNPIFGDYINNATDGLVAPEVLTWVKPEDSPTGQLLLLAGYEDNDGGIGVYSVSVFAPAPAALLVMSLIGLALRRRRSA